MIASIESLEPRTLLSHTAPPGAPTDLLAVADAQAPTIRLFWKNNSTKATGVIIESHRKLSLPWQTLAILPAGSTYFRVGHLASGTSYAFRVLAFNRAGDSAGTTNHAQTYTAGMPYIDTTFGNKGGVHFANPSEGGHLALSPDGNTIYVLGSTDTGGTISKVSSSGALLSTFAATFAAPFANVASMTVEPDGKLLVAGNAGSSVAVARFNPDGSLDTTFNGTGQYQHDFGEGETVVGVAVDTNGSIYLGGGNTDPTTHEQQFFAIRLTSKGTLDSTYGNNGIVQGGGLADPGSLRVLTVAQNMTLINDLPVVVGYQAVLDGNAIGTYAFYSVQLEVDGQVKTHEPQVVGGFEHQINDLLLDNQGRLLIAGYNSFAPTLGDARLTTNFSADPTWVGSYVPFPFNEYLTFEGLAQLPDGSYITVGTQRSSDQLRSSGFIAHLRASDGSLIGGYTFTALTGPTKNISLDHVATDTSGNIYALAHTPTGLVLYRYRI